MGNEPTSSSYDTKRDWVEPDVAELQVAETQLFIGRGRDGSRQVDCTRS